MQSVPFIGANGISRITPQILLELAPDVTGDTSLRPFVDELVPDQRVGDN